MAKGGFNNLFQFPFCFFVAGLGVFGQLLAGQYKDRRIFDNTGGLDGGAFGSRRGGWLAIISVLGLRESPPATPTASPAAASPPVVVVIAVGGRGWGSRGNSSRYNDRHRNGRYLNFFD